MTDERQMRCELRILYGVAAAAAPLANNEIVSMRVCARARAPSYRIYTFQNKNENQGRDKKRRYKNGKRRFSNQKPIKSHVVIHDIHKTHDRTRSLLLASAPMPCVKKGWKR